MSDGNERVPIYSNSESAFVELILADISLSSEPESSPPGRLYEPACVYRLLTDLESSGNRLSLTFRAHVNSPNSNPAFGNCYSRGDMKCISSTDRRVE